MAAYDGWGYPGRRARARQHGGYDHGWAYGRHGWRLPDWWGDPYDPRYAGFQLPRRYPRERYDGAARREFHEWLDDHPTGSTTYGRGMTDEELRSAVRRRLYEDPALDAERIQVEVNDRIVRLSGTVRDYLEARYAWDDAWETEGVEGVLSSIGVEPE